MALTSGGRLAGVLVGGAGGLIKDVTAAGEILTRFSAEAESLLASKAPGLVSEKLA